MTFQQGLTPPPGAKCHPQDTVVWLLEEYEQDGSDIDLLAGVINKAQEMGLQVYVQSRTNGRIHVTGKCRYSQGYFEYGEKEPGKSRPKFSPNFVAIHIIGEGEKHPALVREISFVGFKYSELTRQGKIRVRALKKRKLAQLHGEEITTSDLRAYFNAEVPWVVCAAPIEQLENELGVVWDIMNYRLLY
jgi:hypothetical protein